MILVNALEAFIISLEVMETVEPSIREILANNIKENRRKCGFSQEKLAEKAGISTPFLAMIEVSRKFPTPNVLDQLARALNIKTYQLFAMPPSPDDIMERLYQKVAKDIDQVVAEAVEKAIAEKYKKKE
ncbi:MAG: helix-turn-helix transcriptional regulator [Treponema sp.]|nr:helix-turn-helix transcriptional regulator [Treponema sp.]